MRQVTLGVVVLGLVWRAVRYAMAFPLWGDEAFLAVNFLTRDLAGLGRPLEFKQVAPPAFLWAEYALVRGLGGSEWSLRLVPFLAGVASLGLFWRFCREVATRRVTLVAVALFAASFYPVRQLMLYMAPAFCLLAGEGIVALLRAGRGLRRGPVVAAGLLALFPVIGMVCDVRMPYRRSDDLEYRRFARRLAEQAAPGDRWVVFDGVGGLPDKPWVMASVWVQRVAKLRYYLLSCAPVPVRWESEPRNVGRNLEGRTWLIVHDHGFRPIYPHALRAVYEPIVRARLGPPRSAQEALPVGSTVEVHTFEPTVGRSAVSRIAEAPDGTRVLR